MKTPATATAKPGPTPALVTTRIASMTLGMLAIAASVRRASGSGPPSTYAAAAMKTAKTAAASAPFHPSDRTAP